MFNLACLSVIFCFWADKIGPFQHLGDQYECVIVTSGVVDWS